MKPKTTKYALEIYRLQQPYRDDNSLPNAIKISGPFDSDTPFGAFSVGDGVAEAMTYLGKIQHVHHWIGDFGDEHVIHKIGIYLYADHS